MTKVTFTVGTRNYDFRRPIFGNSDQISFQRVNRRSRGGDLIIFRDAEWPKTEQLHLTFDFQEESDYRRMIDLVVATVGKIIRYRDHENRLWEGVIANPEVEASQVSKNSWVIPIVFEGDLVP